MALFKVTIQGIIALCKTIKKHLEKLKRQMYGDKYATAR